jgi:hypothetical protein
MTEKLEGKKLTAAQKQKVFDAKSEVNKMKEETFPKPKTERKKVTKKPTENLDKNEKETKSKKVKPKNIEKRKEEKEKIGNFL